jgi:hypothetical protein
VWFERWIAEGYSVRQLALQSGHSRDKLYRIIDHWLYSPPQASPGPLSQYQHLILDGTFLHRPVSIITLMDGETNTVLAGRYGVKENSDEQMRSFFRPLIARGLHPQSCTLDGNPPLVGIVRSIWPGITIQRCLVHIQRQGLSWCRRSPKTASARELRGLFRTVTDIKTEAERDSFFCKLKSWEERYGAAIAAHPERGRVFSDTKRARSMLLKALPDMFHYLEDPGIPATTNSLESYFSRLKRHYGEHRGLSRGKRFGYFEWYFTLRPK